jgi:hypothetical protein
MNVADSHDLTADELREIWLGPNPNGSVFKTRQQLRKAWMRSRAQAMKLWGQDGRRPQAFWEFDSPVPFPGRDLEQSTLWRLGVFSADEKVRVERQWREALERAQDPNFSYCLGPAEFLIGDLARKAHYKWCDIPSELIQKWSAERRRRKERPPNAIVEGAEGLTHTQGTFNSIAWLCLLRKKGGERPS